MIGSGVSFDYSAILSGQAIGGSSYSAIVSGGWAGDDLLVTLNCVVRDDPQPGEIVHSVGRKDVPGTYVDQYEFDAQIGDVIGLHCGVESTAYTGGGSAEGGVSAAISLTLGGMFVPSMADFDGSGKVDLADFALFASAWLWQEPGERYL